MEEGGDVVLEFYPLQKLFCADNINTFPDTAPMSRGFEEWGHGRFLEKFRPKNRCRAVPLHALVAVVVPEPDFARIDELHVTRHLRPREHLPGPGSDEIGKVAVKRLPIRVHRLQDEAFEGVQERILVGGIGAEGDLVGRKRIRDRVCCL